MEGNKCRPCGIDGVWMPGCRRVLRFADPLILHGSCVLAGVISPGRERCQFPFVLDEKPSVVSVDSAEERSGGARKAACGRLARIQSQRAPSARVGKSSFKCCPTGGAGLTLPQPCQNYMYLCQTISIGTGLMEIPTRLFVIRRTRCSAIGIVIRIS